jgi:hypothetical protein
VSDFFEPGVTYLEDAPFRAPELITEFRCVAVAIHPKDGTLRAFGFERFGACSPWKSSAMREHEWSAGWVVACD